MIEKHLSAGMFQPFGDIVNTMIDHEPSIVLRRMTSDFFPGEPSLSAKLVFAENRAWWVLRLLVDSGVSLPVFISSTHSNSMQRCDLENVNNDWLEETNMNLILRGNPSTKKGEKFVFLRIVGNE